MAAKDTALWESVAHRAQPNWYLDPLVAQWKKRDHVRLLNRWNATRQPVRVLKTDLFEEAFGADSLLFDLFPDGKVCGIDLAISTVKGAREKAPGNRFHFGVADLRKLPFKPGSFDFILSTSSLDHFEAKPDFAVALKELIEALSPGGRLVLTLDNIWNPLYFPLKWFSRCAWSPFPLGYAPGLIKLKRVMVESGLDVLGTDCLVHNPRMFSTILFLALRRVLGSRADLIISGLLKMFSLLDHLPTRFFSACFVAIIAEKPGSPVNPARQ
jgi:SAM-dependent methyltransferase